MNTPDSSDELRFKPQALGELDLSELPQAVEELKELTFLWKIQRKISDTLSPKSDLYVKALKANNTNSIEYVFDKRKFAWWPVPRIAAALIWWWAMYMQGHYEIDHVVKDYALEAFKMFWQNAVNLIFSLFNMLEATLDIIDQRGRYEFLQQLKRERGEHDKYVISTRNRFVGKTIWDRFTTVLMVIGNTQFREYQLEINAWYQALEQFVERPLFGSSLWSYLADLKKTKPGLLLATALLSIVFGGVHYNSDLNALRKSAINFDYLRYDEGFEKRFWYLPEYPKQPYMVYDNKRRAPNQVRLSLRPRVIECNFLEAELIRDDIVGVVWNQKVHLYTIETASGITMRVLTLTTLWADQIAWLSTKQLVGFSINDFEKAYKWGKVDPEETWSFLLIPAHEVPIITWRKVN